MGGGNVEKFRKSHPSRVRGLKLQQVVLDDGHDDVAPFTGAWIETPAGKPLQYPSGRSHPSRVRGLKRFAKPKRASAY